MVGTYTESSINSHPPPLKVKSTCQFHISISVAKRIACLQPKETHGYQYLFAVPFFNFYVKRGRISKGHIRGLANIFKIRDRLHRILGQILREIVALISILAQISNTTLHVSLWSIHSGGNFF